MDGSASPSRQSWLGRLVGADDLTIAVREQVVSIPGWPAALDGLRIAHISDMHLRGWDSVLASAHEVLSTVPAEMVAVTGDFCVHPDHPEPAARLINEFFPSLPVPPLGQFAVIGNHDRPRLMDLSGDCGLDWIGQQCRVIERNGQAFNLIGLDGGADREGVHVRSTLNGRQRGIPTVALCHFPSTARHFTGCGVDLMLAGHTHGGQIRLPGIGCIWPNDDIPRQYAWGLHTWRSVRLHVTSGIGSTAASWLRWNCPAEIALLELRGA